MVKSLLNLCLSAVCQHRLHDDLALMPAECKRLLLEFFSSHDQLAASDCNRLVSLPLFNANIDSLSFYLAEDLTDEMLIALTSINKTLQKITLVECPRVTDEGIRLMTKHQNRLCQLELRAMRQLTDEALTSIECPFLYSIDLSGCTKITSEGIDVLLQRNPSIACLYLNHCSSLDDRSLYTIAHNVGQRLRILELDFLSELSNPSESLQYLSSHCPNLCQLSIARFFHEEYVDVPYVIDGLNLRDVDLYGNYFAIPPILPHSVTSLRLSVSGEENAYELVRSLENHPYLNDINLLVTVREANLTAIDNVNALLCVILPFLGAKITKLQISVPRLYEDPLMLLVDHTPNLTHLSLDVTHLSTSILHKYFAGGAKSRASKLKSLRICKMRITYRVLFAIARGARNLADIETSHMSSVDDRFICLLAGNCKYLKTVNVNGCKWVSDKGMIWLARRCPLKEVRMRGTACTDKSLYMLGQFCPQLEWISYADYSGKPKFTEPALQYLRDACIQKVIC